MPWQWFVDPSARIVEVLKLAGKDLVVAEGAILVTANRRDMTKVPGLKVEDWARAGV